MSSDPSRDQQRLEQWLASVPTARPWLEERIGRTLDGTPESLVPVWAWGLTQCASRPYPAEDSFDPPAWVDWPETRELTRWHPKHTLEMMGAVMAYYGQTLIDVCTLPLDWAIMRCPPVNIANEGSIIVRGPELTDEGMPTRYTSPERDVGVQISKQLRPLHFPDEVVPGRGDPHGLLRVFNMRRENLG